MFWVKLFETTMPLRSLCGGSDGSIVGWSFSRLLSTAANEFKLIELAICDSCSSAAGLGVLAILKLFEGAWSSHSSSSAWDGIGDNRPPRLLTVEALDEVRGLLKLSPRVNDNGDSDSGIVSNESELELFVGETFPGEVARFASRARLTDSRGLEGDSSSTSFIGGFLVLPPRLFSVLGAESNELERLRFGLLVLASGFTIHQELFPFPSFCTLTNLLWRDKLWRIEFCNKKTSINVTIIQTSNRRKRNHQDVSCYKIRSKMYYMRRNGITLTFQPAELLLSPLSLKKGIVFTIHS